MTGNKQLIWDKTVFFIILKNWPEPVFIIKTGFEDNSIVNDLGLFIDKLWLLIVMENLETYSHKIINNSWLFFILFLSFV